MATDKEKKMNAVMTGDRRLPQYDISGLTVLILEKHSLMRDLMKQVFQEFRVKNVHITDDVNAAFGIFCETEVDLILTDWSQGIDGMGFLSNVRLHEDSPNPYVPVIVVTANTEIKHVFTARDTGMTEYLAKPVSAQLIYSRICATIDSTRPFVRAGGFFGPDRRRHRGHYAGVERRTTDLHVRRAK